MRILLLAALPIFFGGGDGAKGPKKPVKSKPAPVSVLDAELIRLRVELHYALDAAERELESQFEKKFQELSESGSVLEQEWRFLWDQYLVEWNAIEGEYSQQIAALGAGPALASSSGSALAINATCEFCTFTPGGWGNDCHGHNPGCILDAHFYLLYPNGLILGDPDGPDGDGLYSVTLATPDDVRAYLRGSGMPSVLEADYVAPTSPYGGSLGQHIVAARLNILGGVAGVLSGEVCNPKKLIFTDCVADPLLGKTITAVLRLAERTMSSEFGVPANPGQPIADANGDGVPDVSLSDLTGALTVFNEAFVTCSDSSPCLVLGLAPPAGAFAPK